MKASIDKLRWALAGGSLLLLLLLIAVVGYGRYKAAMLWKNRLNALGVHIEQTTDNVTYSQTIKGRTVFTLRAGKAVQRKNGKTVLHNVQMTLYGKTDDSQDRIYGSEFEYDDKTGIARALGDVEMDIGAPGTLVKNGKSGQGEQAGVTGARRDIHVRTSGLTYVRKLGVAATDQLVMFNYAGLQCTAKGAEFDSGDGIVHLLADVQLQGTLHGKPVALHAAKADLNHTTELVTLSNPVLESGNEKGSAASAVLHLRHDGSVETEQAEGNVVLQKETRQISAARLDGSFTSDNVPKQASLSGGVTLVDTNALKPMHGSATRLDGVFNAAGAPVKWTAVGGVRLSALSHSTAGQLLSRSVNGDRMEASLRPGQKKSESELSELHVSGSAQARGEAAASGGGMKMTQVTADDLRAFFGAGAKTGSPELEHMVATGHSRLQQDAPGGAQQTSIADNLQLNFAPDAKKNGELQLANATQDGSVEISSRPARKANESKAEEPISARASHSLYDGSTENLTLTGNAEFQQGTTHLAANSLIVNQQTGNSDGEGNVFATLTPAESRSDGEPTHIHAERAHLVHSTQTGTFYGSDSSPARLWQGASQIEAATITLDGRKRTLSARPDSQGASVRTVFASAQEGKPGISTPHRDAQVERISAFSLDYDDLRRVATFTGNVHAQGETGQLQAQHAQMYFAPPTKTMANAPTSSGVIGGAPSMGGSLERAVVWGDVRLSQPGKTGRGEKLVYTTADSTFVLTGSPGHPPQVVDAEQGSVTGAALTFQSGDNKVVVSGSSPSATLGEHTRVHTETGAKQ